MTAFAGSLSCGGEIGVTPTSGVQHQPVFLPAVSTLVCPVGTGAGQSPTGFGAFLLPPGAGGLPFAPLQSLTVVANPVLGGGAPTIRGDLTPYIANLTAAIQLGKALFWDIQAGSDHNTLTPTAGTACATCHFHAGADVRTKGELNPGPNGLFDAGTTLNYSLAGTNYPFNNPLVPASLSNDNVTGSQGVRAMTFGGINPNNGAETVTLVTDPVFATTRQVTGKNTPSNFNAVFNHRNFHNGRAQPEFNGVNPWGNRDPTARVYQTNANGVPVAVNISIPTSSLASQAVGPPLNPVEMSAAGRTFPDLGRKMLLSKPLDLQLVSPTDSVLGPIDNPKGNGLTKSYLSLIQAAFQAPWWNAKKNVTINNITYSQVEANFSLFWGLSIMLYEATLVANNSPMDQYLASRVVDNNVTLPNGAPNPNLGRVTTDNPALVDAAVNRINTTYGGIPVTGGTRLATREDILIGLDLFERPVPPPGTVGIPTSCGAPGCTPTVSRYANSGLPAPGGAGCGFCHVGAELTSASIRNLTVGVEAGGEAAKNAGFDLRMERMFMGLRPNPLGPPQPPPPVPNLSSTIVYDSGSYTVNVTQINNAPVTPQAVKINTYDAGWYNVGVRPSGDDLGVGGTDLNGLPLSWVRYLATTLADPTTILVPGGGLGCVDANGLPIVPPSAPLLSIFAGEVMDPVLQFPILFGALIKAEGTDPTKSDADGSFKTLHLRNVELNGPYFHNGGKATLRQVIDLYDDGGNFANSSLPPLIRPLGLTEEQKSALVAFMLALTDDRVRTQQGPFDHPNLPVPAGQDATGADIPWLGANTPAVGSAGGAEIPRFLGLNPFSL